MKGIIVAEDVTKAEIDELFAVPIGAMSSWKSRHQTYTPEAENDAPFVVSHGLRRQTQYPEVVARKKAASSPVVPAGTKAEDVLHSSQTDLLNGSEILPMCQTS